MDKRKRAKLRSAGWTVGTPREFLGLSDGEAAFVEFKLGLSKTLQALRAAQELSQVDVAKRLQSSQSPSPRWKLPILAYPSIFSSGRCSSLGHNQVTLRKRYVRVAESQRRNIAPHPGEPELDTVRLRCAIAMSIVEYLHRAVSLLPLLAKFAIAMALILTIFHGTLHSCKGPEVSSMCSE